MFPADVIILAVAFHSLSFSVYLCFSAFYSRLILMWIRCECVSSRCRSLHWSAADWLICCWVCALREWNGQWEHVPTAVTAPLIMTSDKFVGDAKFMVCARKYYIHIGVSHLKALSVRNVHHYIDDEWRYRRWILFPTQLSIYAIDYRRRRQYNSIIEILA